MAAYTTFCAFWSSGRNIWMLLEVIVPCSPLLWEGHRQLCWHWLLQCLPLETEWQILLELEKFISHSACYSPLVFGILINSFAWYLPKWWPFISCSGCAVQGCWDVQRTSSTHCVCPQPRHRRNSTFLQAKLSLHLRALQDSKSDQDLKHLQLQLLQTSTLFNTHRVERHWIYTLKKTKNPQTKSIKLFQKPCILRRRGTHAEAQRELLSLTDTGR